MATGYEAFRRIQAGRETTAGTAVSADKKLVGRLRMTPRIGFHEPEDERGSLAMHHRSKPVRHDAQFRFQSSATYEQILDLLAMCLDEPTVRTPTSGVKTRDYIFTPSLTSPNDQQTYTIEYGDNEQVWRSDHIFAESVDLGIAMGDILSVSASLIGQFPSKLNAFTSVNAEPNLNEILSDSSKFYIDGTWANLGTTIKSSLLAGGTIRLNSGLVPVRYGRGLTTRGTESIAEYHGVSQRRRMHNMDLDLIINDSHISDIYDAFVSDEGKAIRIIFEDAGTGNRIEVKSGTSFYRALEISMFGKFRGEPEIFGEREGENMVRWTFASYDDGSGNELSVRVRVSTDDVSGL